MSIARKFCSLSRKWTHSFPDVVCNLAGSTGRFRVDLWGGRWVICVIKSCTDDLVKKTVLAWHLIAFGGLRWSQMGGNDLGFWHVSHSRAVLDPLDPPLATVWKRKKKIDLFQIQYRTFQIPYLYYFGGDNSPPTNSQAHHHSIFAPILGTLRVTALSLRFTGDKFCNKQNKSQNVMTKYNYIMSLFVLCLSMRKVYAYD